jgi:transposase
MKTMYEYDLVRRMFYREGLSRHEIARRTGLHRQTIAKMLLYSSPPGYRLKQPRPKTKLGPYLRLIDQYLSEDKTAPSKQRHTAWRIFCRLRNEQGYSGGYTMVKDCVREKKIRLREVYFPLEQRKGTSQIDFGTAQVIIAGKRQKAHLFCMVLPYSDAIFVRAYPTEALEALQDGHNAAYAFFNGVPPRALYDNTSLAVKAVHKGRVRETTDGFLALRSHYLFISEFCNVARPNEKGVVERLVGYIRKNFLVPVPRVSSWEELNDRLTEECQKRLSAKASGKDKTVGELLDEERDSFLPLPPEPFDACKTEERHVSSLSMVTFKNNSYSVPVRYAYREVTVKAYVFDLKICYKNEVIASHPRSYLQQDFICNPLDYVPLLEHKPGGLDSARPFTSWDLPACFNVLRQKLESRSGNAGKREYILILQLLRDFTLMELRSAIETALEHNCPNYEAVKMILLSLREPAFKVVPLSSEKLMELPRLHLETTDASSYRTLLAGGGA